LGDKIDEDEGFDPGVLFEEQRGNLQEGFEEAVKTSMTPLAQWAVKNYTPEVRNVGYKCQFSLLKLPRKAEWAGKSDVSTRQPEEWRVPVEAPPKRWLWTAMGLLPSPITSDSME
jgi:hypothetical protein